MSLSGVDLVRNELFPGGVVSGTFGLHGLV
jgi:hypothetical protein